MSDRSADIKRPTEYGSNENILTRIHGGMDVYDRDGERVGTVKQVYLGAVGDEGVQPGSEPSTISPAGEPAVTPGTMAPAPVVVNPSSSSGNLPVWFSRDSDLPETIRNRLLYEGFIRVEGGLLSKSRFVERQQIESVSGDRVTLNALREELFED